MYITLAFRGNTLNMPDIFLNALHNQSFLTLQTCVAGNLNFSWPYFMKKDVGQRRKLNLNPHVCKARAFPSMHPMPMPCVSVCVLSVSHL